ncbi:MAG: FkbM family methyltransferase [Terriglobales bacterium]
MPWEPVPVKPEARKAAFILSATDQGTFILDRFDYRQNSSGDCIGVGHNLLNDSAYEPTEITAAIGVLEMMRELRGTGVVALDCGANIGVHTVAWARAMTGWGAVTAFEPQERLYYALAGNIALNNCFNARAHHAAVGASCGTLPIPVPDYTRPGSFGSLEMRPRPENEDIGQVVDYSPQASVEVPLVSVDSLALARLDFLKIDVEAMEMEVLTGARQTLCRCRPVIQVEVLKDERALIQPWLEAAGYSVFGLNANLLAVHASDPLRRHLHPAA